MLKRFIAAASIVTLSIGMSACEKIAKQPPENTLFIEKASMLDAIPLAYGKLVNITSGEPYVAVLWFEKPDKAIVAVRVNYARGGLNPSVLTIQRK